MISDSDTHRMAETTKIGSVRSMSGAVAKPIAQMSKRHTRRWEYRRCDVFNGLLRETFR